jgi:hypothetical protein
MAEITVNKLEEIRIEQMKNLALKLPREPVNGLLDIKPHRYE